MIHTFFRNLGLTDNEKTIYLFLLKHGYSMASIIGKRLNIKRVTVYASLEGLKRKGLVSLFEKNNVTHFEAVAPEKIVELCLEKVAYNLALKKEAEAILPVLKKLESEQIMPVVEIKGKIKYYEGLEAVKGLIDETLQEGQKEQLCFGLNQYHVEHLADEWKKYTKKRVSVDMNVKSIQPDTKAARAYKKRDPDELRVTRLVPHQKFPTQCELNIIGDMIALFTAHGDQPTGMKIYNKDMAQVLRSLFELAWERAEEYDKN